jgi:CheY-like chemotaxis protein
VQRDVARTGSRPLILVVEDEVLIAMEIEQALADLRCSVLGPAPSVALALIEREKPDFAILDVNLGRERSAPVAEALRERGVPFALATGYDRSQATEEAYRDAPHLGKPLDHQRLVGALARLRDWPNG